MPNDAPSNPAAPTAAGGGVRTLTVTARDRDQRIDNFLLRELKGLPRSAVYRLLRSGQVRVNSGRVKPAHRLRDGDRVRLPPVRLAESQPRAPGASVLAAVAGATLYEDARLLVLDKPAGIAVHGGSGLSGGVIEALRRLRPDLPALELAHRLDRDTSGCLLLAKDRDCLRQLNAALRDRRVDKRYLALLAGRWQGGPRQVDLALARDAVRGGERRVEVREDGKHARSHFKPLRRLPGATFAEVAIGTGRTHQIRVHARSLGHPLLGDEKYGDREANRAARAQGLRRLFLHAWRIGLPLDGQMRYFEAPLPADLQAVLDRMAGA